jgi:hypothetical protein
MKTEILHDRKVGFMSPVDNVLVQYSAKTGSVGNLTGKRLMHCITHLLGLCKPNLIDNLLMAKTTLSSVKKFPLHRLLYVYS